MSNYRSGPYYQPKGLFGNWIVDNMIKHEMTIVSLSEKIGVHRLTVSRYINGHKYPSYSTIKKLCNIFNESNFETVYDMIISDKEGNDASSIV